MVFLGYAELRFLENIQLSDVILLFFYLSKSHFESLYLSSLLDYKTL